MHMSSRKATAASVLCKIIIINFRLVVVQHLLQFSAVVPTVTAFHPSVGLSNPTRFPTRVRRTPSIISSSIIRSYQHRSSQSTSSIVGTRDHSSILVSSQQWATTTSRLFASSSSSSDINMLHYNSIGSTQDEVRQILGDESRHEPNTYVAITTESQTNGRGTNNRTWIGRKGNTFLTLAIPSKDLKIPLTLLPLQIGLILVEQVHSMLINIKEAVVNVKWPNDVLVNEKKIAGVLIESEQDYDGNYYFLVGIGVNYRFAPMVDASGAQRGREATCIYDCVSSVKDNNDNDNDIDNDGVEEAKALGIKIANDIKAWMELQKSWDGAADSIVTRWENWADFGTKLTLRDEPGNEIVIPLGLEKDGRLRVKGQNGKERLLCFDYLL